MRTAYAILEVTDSANDDVIKQAYLSKVHAFPPERAPQKFQEIRNAYEAIKTARQRAEYDLLHEPDVNLQQLLADHLPAGEHRRPSLTQILHALAESV